MNGNRKGSSLVETLVCTLLAATVIIGGLDLSALAIRTVILCGERRERAIALSSMISEIGAGRDGGGASGSGWSASTVEDGRTGAVAVTITGAIGSTSLDISWREWPVNGR
ncbi:MAG: hypothetical protein LBS93_01100 [Synergistaceae bacterium]|jgi:hypothetical protein|nr:hypothetical protein [Synergistaceae bacterium]